MQHSAPTRSSSTSPGSSSPLSYTDTDDQSVVTSPPVTPQKRPESPSSQIRHLAPFCTHSKDYDYSPRLLSRAGLDTPPGSRLPAPAGLYHESTLVCYREKRMHDYMEVCYPQEPSDRILRHLDAIAGAVGKSFDIGDSDAVRRQGESFYARSRWLAARLDLARERREKIWPEGDVTWRAEVEIERADRRRRALEFEEMLGDDRNLTDEDAVVTEPLQRRRKES
ncbi:hypothetical protein P7C70_g6509, partial [Phenoliferia sp. Uapishka_3]